MTLQEVLAISRHQKLYKIFSQFHFPIDPSETCRNPSEFHFVISRFIYLVYTLTLVQFYLEPQRITIDLALTLVLETKLITPSHLLASLGILVNTGLDNYIRFDTFINLPPKKGNPHIITIA